jgi:hypothetical protein
VNVGLDVLIPALVGILTAAGALTGLHFRDADAYERRRGVWQWLLVLAAAIAVSGAVNSASGVGNPLGATLMAAFGAAAAIVAHLMWRRLVPEAEPRTRLLAALSTAAAVVVVAASVTLTYVSGEGCRQADPLVQSSFAHSALILPVFEANQGPTVGDFDTWAKDTGAQARAVTAGDVAKHAQRMAELAGQIADTARANDKATHAVLGARYYDELKAILTKCHSKQ